MQTITLNNGTHIPTLGLGLWRIRDEQECITAISSALAVGFRHFDTAQVYENEVFLGKALAAAAVPRKDLFITTKIWNENMGWADLIATFDDSLRDLQMEYVDLLLLHFPVTERRRPAWPRMEELAASGRARAIGVSNYTITHLEELLRECSIKPAVNQVELHVYLQQPELLAFCREHDIAVEAYSPLAHGYGVDNPVLKAVGDKHHKSPAQVMIRWCLEMGAIALPKSVHAGRIQENFDVFDFSLDDDDQAKLIALNRNYRTCWDPTHVA